MQLIENGSRLPGGRFAQVWAPWGQKVEFWGFTSRKMCYFCGVVENFVGKPAEIFIYF